MITGKGGKVWLSQESAHKHSSLGQQRDFHKDHDVKLTILDITQLKRQKKQKTESDKIYDEQQARRKLRERRDS